MRWLVRHSENPMGMQYAEIALQSAIQASLPPDVEVERHEISPWAAARGPGRTRVPVKASEHRVFGPVIGRALSRGAHVHRFDLRLPPARDEILTVHDVAPLLFPDEGALPRHARSAVNRAQAVVAPSQFSADQIRLHLGVAQVEVVPNGVDDLFRQGLVATPDQLAGFGIDRPFVLHAGGAGRRKGLDDLAAAWQALDRQDLLLVMTGPPHVERDALFGHLPGTRILGRRSQHEVAALMGSATLVVVPSRHEGFGLPVLEAMASGTPVVTTGGGAIREVAGDAAEIAEQDPEALALGMSRVVDDAGLRDRLVVAGRHRVEGFTWAAAGQAYVDLYRAVWSVDAVT